MKIIFSALIFLAGLSVSGFPGNQSFPEDKSNSEVYPIEGARIDLLVKEEIDQAKKTGKAGITLNTFKTNKEAELSGEFFSFITRQFNSFSSGPADLKIKILSAVMIILAALLTVLLIQLKKIKKRSSFIDELKKIKDTIAFSEPGLISANLNNIRKLLCANPVCLYDKIAKNPEKSFSRAAKTLNIAQGEVQLAAKIRSYQVSRVFSNEIRPVTSKLNKGI